MQDTMQGARWPPFGHTGHSPGEGSPMSFDVPSVLILPIHENYAPHHVLRVPGLNAAGFVNGRVSGLELA